jgi:hypothetical protein
MSDYQLRYRPASIRLLDEQLHLDPDTIRIMREIEAQMTARQMVNLWLQPDWHALMPTWQSMLLQPDLFPARAQRPSATQYVPGAGPSTPRPGELSDVARAVYQLPVVQNLVLQAHDEGLRQLRLLGDDWDRATPGDRVAMVSITGVVAASSLTFILANRQTRLMAFDLIKGRDIPVPMVDGLSFQILDRGGAITAPLGVAGLSGSARMQFPSGTSPDYEFSVNFDVMEFIRSNR